MTARKVERQSSRNSKINLSHTIEGSKTKTTNNHTITHKHTSAKITYFNRGAGKLVILKKSKNNTTVTPEITP